MCMSAFRGDNPCNSVELASFNDLSVAMVINCSTGMPNAAAVALYRCNLNCLCASGW